MTRGVFRMTGGQRSVTAFTTSRDGWDAGITRRTSAFACITWACVSGGVGTGVGRGESAHFSFATRPGVPTTESFTLWDKNTNWSYYTDSTVYGNTILAVPVPEPSSFLALCAGLVSAGTMLLRRRRLPSIINPKSPI